jgi:hypothetical protein
MGVITPNREELVLNKLVFAAVFMTGLIFTGTGYCQTFTEQVTGPVSDAITIRQSTQTSEDAWFERKAELTAEFEALTRETLQLAALNKELEQKTTAQHTAVNDLKREIDEIARMTTELLPFLHKIRERLADLVASGLPFLAEERNTRLKNLDQIINDANVAVSEKFRKVMEALSIEAEYGNTIEIYQKKISVGNNNNILADIFRLGRLSLFFQSLDQTETGYFDPLTSRWQLLPRKYNRDIGSAFEIGAKRRSADLLNLPLGRIKPQ